jgi:hypothetical protein
MANGNGNHDRLYELLPAVYQERDAAEGYPLRALLRLVGEQAEIVRADTQQLWDDFFIETCRPWIIPYIGDLVSNNLLHDANRIRTPDTAHTLFRDLVGRVLRPAIPIRTRADVAKTIYYRRRKGTLPMLEELARDVTGWAAHVVEFFELLGWTQWVRNHLRMHRLATPDIRRIEPLDRLDGPFDAISHTVDVRPIRQTEGWHNIRNVGFFLWRLRSYPAEHVVARQAAQPWQYHFSPLGSPSPLFSRWRREGDEAGLATELHVPGPIRSAALFEDLRRFQALPLPRPDHTAFYGLFDPFPGSGMVPCPECSFVIVRDGAPVPPNRIRCQNLGAWSRPTGNVVGVDVRRGRMAFGTTFAPTRGVDVYYHYGFSADLGGGPYERGKWLVRPELAELRLWVNEDGSFPPGVPAAAAFTSLSAALARWASPTVGRPNTVITILDNRTYTLPSSIELRNDHWLVMEAENGRRPHLKMSGGVLRIVGNHPGSELTLSGLLIEGAVHVTGDLRLLRLLHSSLVPGRGRDGDGNPATPDPSLVAEGVSGGAKINAKLRVQTAFSITGPVRLPEHADGLWVLDSIVDGIGGTAIAATGTTDQPGPPTTLERATVLGRSYLKKLPLASEVIFTGPVVVARRQEGCVRFSFVPNHSETPRRYRCQPDLEIAAQIARTEQEPGFALLPRPAQLTAKAAIRDKVMGWMVPTFTAVHYGLPGYAQLRLGCPIQIRTGAEDGSEMGVFCHLKQPQRETNLRIRLEEYLPFGLDPGVIYVT